MSAFILSVYKPLQIPGITVLVNYIKTLNMHFDFTYSLEILQLSTDFWDQSYNKT